jgi:hypothetical protein
VLADPQHGLQKGDTRKRWTQSGNLSFEAATMMLTTATSNGHGDVMASSTDQLAAIQRQIMRNRLIADTGQRAQILIRTPSANFIWFSPI